MQQRLERAVGRAPTGTASTAEQKKKIADVRGATFKDMKPLHAQRVENRKAMADAMQAATIDPAKIEALRAERMKIADESSKRFTKALTDAGNVLTAQQRQAFFKNWSERDHQHHGRRG